MEILTVAQYVTPGRTLVQQIITMFHTDAIVFKTHLIPEGQILQMPSKISSSHTFEIRGSKVTDVQARCAVPSDVQ